MARLDFKMAVGAVAETVQVSGVAPILQTETTTVGEVLSGNTVQSLPLNGRNTGQLTLLLPGTITYNPRGFTNIGSVNMNRPFVNGNREQTNNFTVDGLDVNETIDNRVAYQPIPDALAEISVETNNYAADVGNVGGAVDQQRHQVGREPVPRQRVRVLPEQRLRREHLGEQPIGRAQAGAQAAHLRRHVRRPRRSRTRSSSSATTRASRQDAPGFGDRVGGAGSVAPRRPVERQRPQIRDPRTGLPFPGNQIPLDRISATARALLNDPTNYPLPNRTVPGGITGNFVGETLLAIRAHQGDVRVDWSALGQRQVLRPLFVRPLRGPPRRAAVSARSSRPATISRSTTSAFNWNRVFGSSMINELLVGYSRTTVVAETFDWAGVGAGQCRCTGSPAGSRSTASARSAGAAGSRCRARSRPTRIPSPRPIRSTRR